jgi:hypothetical protein
MPCGTEGGGNPGSDCCIFVCDLDAHTAGKWMYALLTFDAETRGCTIKSLREYARNVEDIQQKLHQRCWSKS